MTGEAGVLGLDDLEKVCHAVEELLESESESEQLVDRLLETKDWAAEI